MLTQMIERDWDIALEAFRLCLPVRGAKAKDDRLFLEALHYFTVHNISWRALPERFGKWNSVWKRFDRLSEAADSLLFETLALMRGRVLLLPTKATTATTTGR